MSEKLASPPIPVDPRFKGATPEALALALRKPKKPKEPPPEEPDNA